MVRLMIARAGQLVIYLTCLTVVVFGLTRLSGDPLVLLLPPNATQQDYDQLARRMGLDRPLVEQYVVFARDLLHGDIGRSYKWGVPASRLLLERLPATLELAAAAMGIATVLGMSAGVIAAIRPDSMVDAVFAGLALVGQSIPVFWLGLMLILVFAVKWPVLPVGGRGGLAHLVLPAITLSWYSTAVVSRVTRSSMIDVLHSDYVKLARIKGVPERVVVLRHALRNALVPIITVSSLEFAILLSGAVVTETVFAWPGVGSLVVEAVLAKDYPVIEAAVLLVSAVFFTVNFFTDLLCNLIDPRLAAGRTP
jgi:peptide/nickel transport system permease protein